MTCGVVSIALAFAYLLMSFAGATMPDCSKLMGRRDSYLELPAQSRRLLIGILVERPQGHYRLVLGDYFFSQHRQLLNAIESESKDFRVLWAGELLVENRDSEPGMGVIVSSLNTSGYIWTRMRSEESDDVNDPEKLKSILGRYRHDLVTPHTHFLSFSDGYPHLEPTFREFHQVDEKKGEETVRHLFRNTLSGMLYFFETVSYIRGPEWQGELKRIVQNLSQERVEGFGRYFGYMLERMSVVSNERLMKLAEVLQKMVDDKVAGIEELFEVTERFSEFESEIGHAATASEVIYLN